MATFISPFSSRPPFLNVTSKPSLLGGVSSNKLASTDKISCAGILGIKSLSNKAIISCSASSLAAEPEGPVIGVLTIPEPTELYYLPVDQSDTSYLSKRLVHGLEKTGSRVIPLFFNESPESFLEKLDLVDGMILSGSISIDLHFTYRVSEAFDEFFKRNMKGFLPLLCIGSSCAQIRQYLGDDEFSRVDFDIEEGRMGVTFNHDTDLQKTIFQFFPQDLKKSLERNELYFCRHTNTPLVDAIRSVPKFHHEYHIVAVTKDANGSPFVSAFSGKGLPITGVHWMADVPMSNIADQAFTQLLKGFILQCKLGDRLVNSKQLSKFLLNGEGTHERYVVSGAAVDNFKFTLI